MKHKGKRVAIIAAVLLLVLAAVGALELTNTTHLFHKNTENLGAPGAINYRPPTQVEKNDSESHKDAPSDQNTPIDSSTSSNHKVVNVNISTWTQKDGSIEVNGYVSGVVEDGGTCTLTLVSATNGKRVTTTRTAIANATNTSCGVNSIPLSNLFAGNWMATLSYSSTTSTGQSTATPIEVK